MVDWARLENEYTGNGIAGSNPASAARSEKCYYLFVTVIKKITKVIFKRGVVFVAALLLVFSLITNLSLFKKVSRFEKDLVVTKVIDGDTFFLKNGQVVRLYSVDAPDIKYCGGEESKNYLEKLVLGKSVLLEDVLMDKTARVLATVFADGKNINRELVKAGWAKYDSSKVTELEEMKVASSEARSQNLGVFSEACRQIENVKNPNCIIKGNISKDSGKKQYSFPGCSEYDRSIIELDLGEGWFCTEKEAITAGYTKMPNCHGKTF